MPIFLASPQVELLKRLVPNSLKQSLPKAVRLWVILQFLYGDRTSEELPDRFTYKDWETLFFTASHQVGRDVMPPPHDPTCACAQSLEYWLFEPEFGVDHASWSQTFCAAFDIDLAALERLLSKHDRLFAVTGRSLENDFEALVKIGCLEFQTKPDGKSSRNGYRKVETLPAILADREANGVFTTAAEFIQTDLSEFVDSLAQPIQGVQRFFLHAEYVVANRLSDRVSDYQAQLKDSWNQAETAPMYLKYRSAREFQEEFHWIIYPVCVFYYQRAPYLFGYGYQVDDRPPSTPLKLEWYDFRLDHIERMQSLEWSDSRLQPTFLTQRQQPPMPEQIHRSMSETWGFEFYRPADCLILRFDRYFYANYIEPTERAAIFTIMRLPEVVAQVGKCPNLEQRRELQQILSQRSAADIYCRINYRVDDRNILMRLRAWGPNVEVISPYGLRQQISGEIQQLALLYRSAES
jgi:CRISPR-associated protein (TIGR03985 family)